MKIGSIWLAERHNPQTNHQTNHPPGVAFGPSSHATGTPNRWIGIPFSEFLLGLKCSVDQTLWPSCDTWDVHSRGKELRSGPFPVCRTSTSPRQCFPEAQYPLPFPPKSRRQNSAIQLLTKKLALNCWTCFYSGWIAWFILCQAFSVIITSV